MPKNHPNKLSQKTLQQINAEFLIHDWSEEELTELISPKYGLISGFYEILDDIEDMDTQDLNDIGPAESIKPLKDRNEN